MDADSSFQRAGWRLCLVVTLVLILSPLHATEDQRLAQLEQNLSELQQHKTLLEEHLQLADSGNYFFIPDGEPGGGLMWPVKQQEFVEHLKRKVGSGQLSSDVAKGKLEQMHEMADQYRRSLAEQLQQTEYEMEQLRTEVRELDRASTEPEPSSDSGRRGASAEQIAQWRAALACLEEGVRLHPNYWLDCNGNWTNRSRDVEIESLRELLREAGAGSVESSPTSERQSKIAVISATYGGNCGNPLGVTQHLADACEGKQRCDYLVDHHVISDPAVGCRKDYVYRWQCMGGDTHPPIEERTVSPEASGQYASLWCW